MEINPKREICELIVEKPGICIEVSYKQKMLGREEERIFSGKVGVRVGDWLYFSCGMPVALSDVTGWREIDESAVSMEGRNFPKNDIAAGPADFKSVRDPYVNISSRWGW